MAKVLLLNGPNLNLLGTREPDVYGSETLPALVSQLQKLAGELGHELLDYQSNHEGALVDRIHQARDEAADCLIFNPGGYTHTSVALRDAVLAVGVPLIEVHLSNPTAREAFRHHSYFSDIAAGCISGFGGQGYAMALRAVTGLLANRD